ncbi:MAG: HAMP domain-containing histidine kinase [Candidatus Dormibacteraeota bacterium]|uniref:histidine kinase n=1 Tax=Candidatus Amunia macphersoniae TaxID=3127014 RepID=A0A934NJ88_9BACT|nr:HAMP domain-containing histidine kinase [Candidatus Dormibacteraeota bacterium]
MARRLGCAAGLLLMVLAGSGTALVWLLLSVTGVVGSAPVARVIAGAGLLLGIGAVIAAAVALRRLTAPAGRIVEAAGRIESGDYSARVPVRGPSELRSLARAFNAMSGRLEADQARRRSVLADVAHELRTPITVIRAQAEGIVDGVYPAAPEQMRPVLAATRTLEVLVDDLRTLGLAEAGALQLHREQVDVGVLVNDTVDAYRDPAAAQGVRLAWVVEPPELTVDADAVRLRSVLANLVRNALRHTGRGGTVTVEAAERGHEVHLRVRDDGDGIDAALLPRVFDRFAKGPASDGSGLGLAIVRDIVEAHGGLVTIASQAGRGTTVTVALPHSQLL